MSNQNRFTVGDAVTIETYDRENGFAYHITEIAEVLPQPSGSTFVVTRSGHVFKEDGKPLAETILPAKLVHRKPEHVAHMQAISEAKEARRLLDIAERDLMHEVVPTDVAKWRELRERAYFLTIGFEAKP